MRALYLANVGNRDLWVDGKPVPAESTLATGRAILDRYDSFRGRLSAPIIERGIEHVLQRGTEQSPVQVRAYLFATDQEGAAEQHRRRDTIYVAKVLERYLRERFAGGRAGHIEDVKAFAVKQNPSYYDTMYRVFGEQLRSKRFDPESVDRCYISPVGGVPAANFGLLLRAVERFGAKAHVVYVPEGSEQVVPMGVGGELRRSTLLAIAREAVAAYEFHRAAELLRQMGSGPVLIGLAEHAQYRLNFDFHRAAIVLDEQVLPSSNDQEREFALGLRRELDRLLAGEMERLIGELFYSLNISYRNGHYFDFLVRLFHLQESVLHLLVERELHLPTVAQGGKAHPDFVRGIESDPLLLAHMRTPTSSGTVLDYQRPPTRAVLRHLVQYILQSDNGKRWRPVVEVLDRLEPLADLRDQSVHRFKGVSREDIERAYPGRGRLLDDLAELVGLLGVDARLSPFDRVREFALHHL